MNGLLRLLVVIAAAVVVDRKLNPLELDLRLEDERRRRRPSRRLELARQLQHADLMLARALHPKRPQARA